ncbi:MAG: diadenylate cyclase CdaA [Candidatus Omnitrophica bacterium]|nr:diadenylate cyclase CdaA [Candidatus Omnitrophota bacterium]
MELFISVLRNTLDILLIATTIFLFLRFFKGSRAMSVLYGLLVVGGVYLFARFLDLRGFTDLVNRVAEVFLVSTVVLFQPEIRRGLARLGVTPLFQKVFQAEEETIKEIVKAANIMAAKRIGALIVITRRSGLKAIVDHGTKMNAEISAELIQSIFNPYSPLHDGAIIVTNNIVVAAGCLLPLSERDHPKDLGTRHRAGLGITEESDAVAIIVSEERGKVSLAYVGELIRDMPPEQLTRQLSQLMATITED